MLDPGDGGNPPNKGSLFVYQVHPYLLIVKMHSGTCAVPLTQLWNVSFSGQQYSMSIAMFMRNTRGVGRYFGQLNQQASFVVIKCRSKVHMPTKSRYFCE